MTRARHQRAVTAAAAVLLFAGSVVRDPVVNRFDPLPPAARARTRLLSRARGRFAWARST